LEIPELTDLGRKGPDARREPVEASGVVELIERRIDELAWKSPLKLAW
jgi:hypothetical protein